MLINCLVPSTLQADAKSVNDFDYFYFANFGNPDELRHAENSIEQGRPTIVDFWGFQETLYDWVNHLDNFKGENKADFGVANRNFPLNHRPEGIFRILDVDPKSKSSKIAYIDALANLVQRSDEEDLIQLDLTLVPNEAKESTRVEIFESIKRMMGLALIPHRKFHLNEIIDLSKLGYWGGQELVHSLSTSVPTKLALSNQRIINTSTQLIYEKCNMGHDPVRFNQSPVNGERKKLVLDNIRVFKKMVNGEAVGQKDYTNL